MKNKKYGNNADIVTKLSDDKSHQYLVI